MMWPFVVSLAILRRELGGLRRPSIKKWIWLNLRSLTASYFPRFGLRLGNLRCHSKRAMQMAQAVRPFLRAQGAKMRQDQTSRWRGEQAI